jgi:hypothetical protein
MDLMVSAFRHLTSFQFFEWTREILQVPGRTVELHMMGTRLILTDEPDNVKAIMSTQVSKTLLQRRLERALTYCI